MQDNSSDVFVSGWFLRRAQGKTEDNKNKQTNKWTKKQFPFQFAEIWFPF